MPEKSSSSAKKDRLIVGISGASGSAIGIRLLDAISELGLESHLVVSKAGAMTIGYETSFKLNQVLDKADYVYGIDDIASPISSGSFRTKGMIIAPCSVKTMSEIASGVTTSLISRAADVQLKERRPLIVMIREAPLHLGHLRSLTQLAEMGAIIFPPLPAFYANPKSVEEIIDQLVGRTLDILGYDWPDLKRWGEDLSKGRRKARKS